jgi:hypothetical protein
MRISAPHGGQRNGRNARRELSCRAIDASYALGHNQLPKVIHGIKFTDGIEVVRSQAQTAAA